MKLQPLHSFDIAKRRLLGFPVDRRHIVFRPLLIVHNSLLDRTPLGLKISKVHLIAVRCLQVVLVKALRRLLRLSQLAQIFNELVVFLDTIPVVQGLCSILKPWLNILIIIKR